MATDPKKDQKDQPEELSKEQIKEVAGGRGPNDGLPEDKLKAIAASGVVRIPVVPDDSLQAKRQD